MYFDDIYESHYEKYYIWNKLQKNMIFNWVRIL